MFHWWTPIAYFAHVKYSSENRRIIRGSSLFRFTYGTHWHGYIFVTHDETVILKNNIVIIQWSLRRTKRNEQNGQWMCVCVCACACDQCMDVWLSFRLIMCTCILPLYIAQLKVNYRQNRILCFFLFFFFEKIENGNKTKRISRAKPRNIIAIFWWTHTTKFDGMNERSVLTMLLCCCVRTVLCNRN